MSLRTKVFRKLRINSGRQFLMVNLVFAVTGTLVSPMFRTSPFVFGDRYSDNGIFLLLDISYFHIVLMLSVLIDRSSSPIWTI